MCLRKQASSCLQDTRQARSLTRAIHSNGGLSLVLGAATLPEVEALLGSFDGLQNSSLGGALRGPGDELIEVFNLEIAGVVLEFGGKLKVSEDRVVLDLGLVLLVDVNNRGLVQTLAVKVSGVQGAESHAVRIHGARVRVEPRSDAVLGDVIRRSDVLLVAAVLTVAARLGFGLLVRGDVQHTGAVLQEIGHLLLRGVFVDIEEPPSLGGVGTEAEALATLALVATRGRRGSADGALEGGIEREGCGRGQVKGGRVDAGARTGGATAAGKEAGALAQSWRTTGGGGNRRRLGRRVELGEGRLGLQGAAGGGGLYRAGQRQDIGERSGDSSEEEARRLREALGGGLHIRALGALGEENRVDILKVVDIEAVGLALADCGGCDGC